MYLSARKLAEVSFNETENLEDINIYQIIIVLSARKLAEALFNETENLDDINIYQIYVSIGSQARRSVI